MMGYMFGAVLCVVVVLFALSAIIESKKGH